MSDLKIQGVVEVSTEGAESSLNRVGSAAESMSRKVETSANQAGKAVDSIGDGAGKSAEEFTRAEGKIVNSIKRATTQLEQLGKTASQKLDLKISTQGLDAAKFEPMLTKLRELEAAQARVGVGSRGMGSQLQNTSYQLQDFIVQVNGGVDATKALGMQLPQMLVGFGAAGAAIGVVAALLPNLVQAFGNSAAGAKDFKEAMSDFDKAIGDVGSTVKSFDMEKLYEQFNDSSSAVRAATIEQVRFQQELIKTQQLIAEKKFGEQISGLGSFGTLDKLAGSFASSGSEKLAKQLGISAELAKDLLPALNGLKSGTEDVNNVFNKFGRSLLTGNASALELAQTIGNLAKAQRDEYAGLSASSEAQERMSKGHVTTKKEADEATKAREKAAKAAEAEAKALENLMDRIYGKDTGLDAGYWNDLERLNNEFKRTGDVDKYADAVGRLTMQQKFYTDELKAQQEIEASRAKYMQSVDDETQKLIEKAKAAEYENSLIGKSADEIGRLTAARYDEKIAILEEKAAAIESMGGRTKEVEAIEQQIDALNRLKSAEVAKPKLQAQAREWEKFTDQINQSLTDALYRSFESGESFGKTFAKNLQNTFKSMVLKFAINAVMTTGSNLANTAINYVAGTSGSNGGSGTNYLGLASNASSAYNLANGSYAATAMGAYAQYEAGIPVAQWALGTYAPVETATTSAGVAANGMAGSSGSTMSASTVGWIAAIIMGMYMSSQAWKAGFKTDGTKSDMNDPTSWPMRHWDNTYQFDKAIFGKDLVQSELYAIITGSSLSIMLHDYIATITGNNGAPKANINTRFSAGADAGYTANPINNGSTAYAGGQEELAASILSPAMYVAMKRFAASDIFDVTLAGHINSQGRSSNQKLAEVSQGGDQIYRAWSESGMGSADFNNFVNDQIPKMQLAIIAEAMRDSSADYKGVVDMVLGTTKDLTDVIGKMSQWDLAGTVQSLFGIADAFDNVKLGLDGLPVAFSDLATVADYARNNAAAAVEQVKAQIASATKDGDTAAVESLTTQLKALQTSAAETDIAAVTRVISETQAFTGVLDLMGKSLSDVFNASNSSQIFALSEALMSMFGTIDAMTTAVNGYVENFYSAEEKRAMQVESIRKRLAQAGLDYTAEQISTASRETFRSVVESLDLTTAAGQAAFKALMDVQSAFAGITSSAVSAVASMQQGTASAMSALSSAIDAERTRVQARLEAAQEQVSTLSGLVDVISSSLSNIYQSVSTTSAREVAKAQSFITNAVANARTTGYLPDSADLQTAISAVRGSQTADNYASAFEFNRAQLTLAAQLEGLKSVADPQLTAAEAAVKLAEDQLKTLDDQLRVAQDQIDALRGINTSVLSVADAIANLQTALTNEIKSLVSSVISSLASGAITATAAQTQLSNAGVSLTGDAWNTVQTSTGEASVWASSGGALATGGNIYTKDGSTYTVGNAIDYVSSTLAAGDARAVYDKAIATGVSAASLDTLMGWTAGTSNAWAEINNLPKFAAGGYYGGGMALVGEQGPEIINFKSPGQIYNANQTGELLGSRATAEEIAELRAEQRAQAAAMAGFMARMARVVEKWDVEGMPEAVTL